MKKIKYLILLWLITYLLVQSCSFQKIDESTVQEDYKQFTDTPITSLIEVTDIADELHVEQTRKTATTTNDKKVGDCQDLSFAYRYAWIDVDTLSAYMSLTDSIDGNGYMCYTKILDDGYVSHLDIYDEIPSNFPNIGLMLKEFTDINFIISAYYSQEYKTILYQKSLGALGKGFYELWKIDLKTNQQAKVNNENESSTQFIYPDSIYWISPTLIFIDSPVADYDKLLIDLESNQFERPFNECKLKPYTRLLFSPDTERVLVLVPDLEPEQNIASVFNMWNIYILSTSDFFENYSECKNNKLEDFLQNRETLLRNGEQLPFNIFSFDAISYYPPIHWDNDTQSIYYIDRERESNTFGDLVKYDIVNEKKTQILGYKTYEEIMFSRDNYLFYGINSSNTKIFIEPVNNNSVFVTNFSK